MNIFRIFIIAWLGHFIVDFMLGIWPVFKTMHHLDLALAGLISGVSALIGEGLQLFYGPLCDRGHQKKLILFGVVAVASSLCFSLTASYMILGLFYLMTCVGSGAFHPAAASMVANLPLRRKGLCMTIFASGGGFGLACSQMIYAYLYSGGENHVFWLLLLPVFLILFLSFTAIPKTELQLSQKPKIDLKQIFKLFHHRQLRLLYFSQFFNQAMAWAFIFMLPDILKEKGCADWLCYGGGHMVFILGSAILSIPGGFLADRFSCKQVILGCFIGSIALSYTLLMAPLIGVANLMTVLFLLGGCFGIANPVILSFGNQYAPNHTGMVSAFLMGLVWCIVELVGQTGCGLLTHLFTFYPAINAVSLMALSLFGGLASAMLLDSKVKEQDLILALA